MLMATRRRGCSPASGLMQKQRRLRRRPCRRGRPPRRSPRGAWVRGGEEWEVVVEVERLKERRKNSIASILDVAAEFRFARVSALAARSFRN